MPRRKMDDQFPRLSGKQFGKRLRQIRVSKNIPSAVVAVKIGVEETYIPQLERGEKLPSFDTLIYLVWQDESYQYSLYGSFTSVSELMKIAEGIRTE